MAYFLLVLGLACAAVGSDFLTRGGAGLAVLARIPTLVIGLTIIAFGTSSPELAVSSTAARQGKPELGFGDATGSNVANIGLILGLALLLRPIRIEAAAVRCDLPAALLAPVITALLAFTLGGLALLILGR